MSALSFFSRQLRPHWQYALEPNWIVWKLLPGTGSIIIDERDPNAFQSNVTAIDIQTGERIWRRSSPFGAWWSNLTAVSGDYAILEGYASPDMPVSKGVAVLDARSGTDLWMQPEEQLLEIGQVAVRTRSSEHGIERQHVRELHRGNEVASSPSALVPPTSVAQYPFDSNREALETAVGPSRAVHVVGPIESLEYGNVTIFSYHIQNERSPCDLMRQSFRSMLVAVKGGRVVLEETLARNSPFPVAGNFVVDQDILIYVVEKTRLVGVHLT